MFISRFIINSPLVTHYLMLVTKYIKVKALNKFNQHANNLGTKIMLVDKMEKVCSVSDVREELS